MRRAFSLEEQLQIRLAGTEQTERDAASVRHRGLRQSHRLASQAPLVATDVVRLIRVVARGVVQIAVPHHETRFDADDRLDAELLHGVAVSRSESVRQRGPPLRVEGAAVLRHGREIDLDHCLGRAVDRLNYAVDRPARDGPIDHHHVRKTDHCASEGLA